MLINLKRTFRFSKMDGWGGKCVSWIGACCVIESSFLQPRVLKLSSIILAGRLAVTQIILL